MLNALFFPIGTEEKPINFESLYIPWIYKEIYFEKVYDFLRDRKDLTIIDFGGNIGVVTQFLRNFAKIVYTVEPSSEHFEALKMNKEFNKWDNVKLFNMALADKNGYMTLNKTDENLTMNSLTNFYGNGEKVKTIRIDTFFKKNNIEHVDFIKLDIEGSEGMVLMSDGFKEVAPKIDAIEIEFHGPEWINLAGYMANELGFNAYKFETDATIVLFKRE